MLPPFVIEFPIFKDYTELVCAFSTRQGGVSNIPFDSLNLGLNTKDNSEHVRRNRSILFSKLNINPDKVAYTDQVHSAHTAYVKKATVYKSTDALICSGRDKFLTIQTADCFPVFIYLPHHETIAVIHAGWRGVVAGIIERTLEKLTKFCNAKPADFTVAIGPGLQSECFEVKKDVFEKIPARFLALHDSPEHKYLDLQAYILEKLKSYGIVNERMYCSGLCTKCEARLFYSYRRDGINSGRMMGIIGLRK